MGPDNPNTQRIYYLCLIGCKKSYGNFCISYYKQLCLPCSWYLSFFTWNNPVIMISTFNQIDTLGKFFSSNSARRIFNWVFKYKYSTTLRALNPRCHDRNFCQKYTVASIEAIVQSSHILRISYIPLHYCETLAKVHLELLM